MFQKGIFKDTPREEIKRMMQFEGFTPKLIKDKPNYIYEPHQHPETKYLACLEGNMQVTFNGKTHNFHPGDKILIPGNTVHSGVVGDKGCIYLWSESLIDNISEVTDAINKFSSIIKELDLNIKDDNSWPVIVNELTKGKDYQFLFPFWSELLIFFNKEEKRVGHCHKGTIYWTISLLYLQNGDITKCLEFLDLSVNEDKAKAPSAFTASIGLSSVLKPLLNRYKRTSWKLDKEINDFYESLTKNEKKLFADEFFNTHDLSAGGVIWIINENSFGFISDNVKRKVIFDTYIEVRDTVMNTNLKTYYSSIFSLGSILEGMLDDLFERDSQKVWNIFNSDTSIQAEVDRSTRLASKQYNSGMTLGEKIKALRLMAKYDKLPMPKQAVLNMLIIGEYRDLIHPRRRLAFEYEPNKYVATFLLTMLSRLAGNWWEQNINTLTD